VKVFIPSENITAMFAIAGVRCPGVARPAGKGPDGKPRPGRAAEPFGAESASFLRETLMQQEVEIQVDEHDKNGAYLGTLWVGKGGARRNVGAELLRRGLGYTIYPVIERVRECEW
jgi:staphylococcal nuclease domain-containing protein 1